MAGLSEARDSGITSSPRGVLTSILNVLSLIPCAAVREGCLCFLEWRVWWEQGGTEAGIGPEQGSILCRGKIWRVLRFPPGLGKACT